ncbi:protein SWEETIE [Manihot esculenta]|nr:protein SWEETIE [Manihot esculenta]
MKSWLLYLLLKDRKSWPLYPLLFKLPRSALEVAKKMLTKPSRNPVAATVEKEAGWLLLSSLLSSMPKEELQDQVFDILSLWAPLFGGNPEQEIKQIGDLTPSIWSGSQLLVILRPAH